MIDAIITVDEVAIREKLGELAHKSDVVMRRAANRALTTANKTVKKETAKRYRIKQSDVNKTLTLHRASGSALYASVVSKGRHENLAQFKVSPLRRPRRKKRGGYTPNVYKAAVEKGGGLKKLDGKVKPFVATMPNGFTGVFQRKVAKQKKGLAGLFAKVVKWRRKRSGKRTDNQIEAVQAPAVPQIIKNDAVMVVVTKEANEMMLKRAEHEIERILKQ